MMMEPRRGIEPRSPSYKDGASPQCLQGQMLRRSGIRPLLAVHGISKAGLTLTEDYASSCARNDNRYARSRAAAAGSILT